VVGVVGVEDEKSKIKNKIRQDGFYNLWVVFGPSIHHTITTLLRRVKT